MKPVPDGDDLRPGALSVLAGQVLPGTPAVADAMQPRDAKAVALKLLEQGSPPPDLLDGQIERLHDKVAAPPGGLHAAGKPLGLRRETECRQDGRGRAHYAVRAAREATISARTLVSAEIASSRVCARSAASSACRRAASAPCTVA